MTPLEETLHRRIQVDGPLTVAAFMEEALLNPTHGYYTTRDPLGAAGDFTTAPEISQMFGELLGLCLAQTWVQQGAPERIALAELGPGRGTLMADVLRVARAVPGFHEAIEVHLLEASPTLQAVQATRLPDATWHRQITDLPKDLPLYVIANEFLDALPIRQFLRDGPGWRERQLGVFDGALDWGLSDIAPVPALEHRLTDTPEGHLVEYCPGAPTVVTEISARIAAHGGCALILDYGDWHSRGDTLQAVRAHGAVDVLDGPGTADLTAHVDFEALAKASLCAVTEMTAQGVFLERLGITERAQALAKVQSGAALEAHIAAHRRLTHPEEMGTLFKCLGLYAHGASPPPGLDAAKPRT